MYLVMQFMGLAISLVAVVMSSKPALGFQDCQSSLGGALETAC